MEESKKTEDFSDCFSTSNIVKIGDKDYIVGEPNIDEMIVFQNWCKEQNKNEIRELANEFGQKINLRELKEMLSDPNYYVEKASSMEGVLFLIKLILKRLNKDYDEKHFMDNVTTEILSEMDSYISPETTEVKNSPEEDQSQPPTENQWLSQP